MQGEFFKFVSFYVAFSCRKCSMLTLRIEQYCVGSVIFLRRHFVSILLILVEFERINFSENSELNTHSDQEKKFEWKKVRKNYIMLYLNNTTEYIFGHSYSCLLS